jgi:hypothetical protein
MPGRAIQCRQRSQRLAGRERAVAVTNQKILSSNRAAMTWLPFLSPRQVQDRLPDPFFQEKGFQKDAFGKMPFSEALETFSAFTVRDFWNLHGR